MNLFYLDNVISDPDTYVEDILSKDFIDVLDGDNVFKGIQPRDRDELQVLIETMLPKYDVVYNFVRQSSVNQEEPNFIHTDEMMGDKTILLYLNKKFPKGYGTTLYKDKSPACKIYADYNRMVIFDSNIPHARNIFKNFGENKDSRLVQVVFVKKNN